MGNQQWSYIAGFVAMVLLTGCNIGIPQATPTVEVLTTETHTATATPSPTATSTATASPTSTEIIAPPEVEVALASPSPTATEGIPTSTLLPAPTEGPFVHTISENETLLGILLIYYPQWNQALVDETVRINPNIVNADLLPPPGNDIFIPRPTPTPVPENYEATLVVDATLGFGERVGDTVLAQGASIECHTVEEGQTIVEIVNLYDTTLEIIAQQNPDLNWFGCDFQQPAGGPQCSPNIIVGQCINVPQPTPVPTSTSTPSGDETATPTPTYPAPRAVYPPDGGIAQPGIFSLQWVSVGILASDERYLVEVVDIESGANWVEVTRDTSVMLPESLIPTGGEPITYQWRVSVASPSPEGIYNYIGGSGQWRTFQWQSR